MFCWVAVLGALFAPLAFAQTTAHQLQPPEQSPPATLVYSNRPITELRATILGRSPAERAAAAVTLLNTIVGEGHPASVKRARVEGVMVVSVGTRNLFVIVPADLDDPAAETIEQKAAIAISQLQVAIDEQIERRTPARLAWSGLQALSATIVFGALLWGVRRGCQKLDVRLTASAEQRILRFSATSAQLVRASRAPDILRRFTSFAATLVALFFSYSWLTFVLRRFPYTRPWGESLREFLLTRLISIGLAIMASVPDLFTVVVIILVTRFVVRFATLVFDAAEHEHLKLPAVFPETAQPTRRLVSTLLWLFALVLAYPYLPGSESDAFKGVSVFVGLIVSLGSSGIVNQVMSGLTLTYSRALRLGDFVRIGDVEGTVSHLGSLSTKIKTSLREDVTIPNAVVVATPITNYSRFADVEGVSVPITVTIGYDVPWRQVHALLLLAAERTAGVKRTPASVVRQTDLRDFYVEYTLLVCLEQPHLRVATLGVLRANIQDAFNEVGVQIMSPNYEADPSTPKVVPREKWYATPAMSMESKQAER